MKLTPPVEYEVPEGKEAGDEVEALVVFRLEEDGGLTPVSIEGHAFPADEPVEEEEIPAEDDPLGMLQGLPV